MFFGVAISNYVPGMGGQYMILNSWDKLISANVLLIRELVDLSVRPDPPICKLITSSLPCFSTKEHM